MTFHSPDRLPTANSLRSLCSVFTSALFSIGHSGTVEDASNNVIAHARQVPDAASTDNDRAVLLKVMIDTRYIGCNFFAVRQPDTSNLT